MFSSANLLAAPVITAQVDPSRSTTGEPVLFKIKIRNDTRERVSAPQIPVLADWDVLSASEAAFPSSFMKNGQIIFRYEGEYTYILKPLRKGSLRIPAVEIQVGSKTYKTDAIAVTVDNLPQGASSRPRYQARPSAPPQGTSPLPGNSQLADEDAPQGNGSVPDTETLFLRAEPSKAVVYQGQLITLSYALYQGDNNLANLEPAKFPAFAGFLKEELVVPKTMTKTPVNIRGRTMFRSEIIRYAIFPLKTGTLAIEPMSLRAEYLQSPRDVLNSLMMGQVPQHMGNFEPIPVMKSSQELKIIVKALPAAPTGTQFTGAVGQFKVDLTGPRGALQVDQPFNVNLTIAGTGNIKSIEEPTLKLPASVETYQTKNSYEFREDATGFKTFEYLLLPRKAGTFTLEPISWTYFDPDKAQYVEVKTPAIELRVEGGASATEPKDAGGAPTPAPVVARFSPVRAGTQSWTAPTPSAPVWFWGGWLGWTSQGIFFAGLLGVFWKRREDEKETLRFTRKPWEKTERRIRTRKEWSRAELANLSDQWMRERLASLADNHQLHSESPREEFIDALKQRTHPQHHGDVEQLRKIWSDLDLMRFAGMQSAQDKTKTDVFFGIQKQVEKLTAKLSSAV